MHSTRDEEAIEGIVPKNSVIVAESLLGPIHPAFTTDDVFIAVSWWGHLLFRSAIGGDLSLSLSGSHLWMCREDDERRCT